MVNEKNPVEDDIRDYANITKTYTNSTSKSSNHTITKTQEQNFKSIAQEKKNTNEKIENNESRERYLKRNNLIMYNVPESNRENAKSRIEDDHHICEKIFREDLNEQNFHIEEIIRLGKSNLENHTRSVLVKVYNEKEKWRIIGKAKNLQYSEYFNNVYITKDMTVKERSENKTLRIELKERRENGEDVLIKNEEIVRRKREINLGDYIVKTKMRNPRAQAMSNH